MNKETLKNYIEAWNDDLRSLEKQVEELPYEAQKQYRSVLIKLRAKKEEFQLRLEDMERKGEDAVDGVTGGLYDLWQALKTGIDAAKQDFKERSHNSMGL